MATTRVSKKKRRGYFSTPGNPPRAEKRLELNMGEFNSRLRIAIRSQGGGNVVEFCSKRCPAIHGRASLNLKFLESSVDYSQLIVFHVFYGYGNRRAV